MSDVASALVVPLSVLVLATRDRARHLVRDAFPRRRTRLTLARSVRDFERAFRVGLVDAALVDLGGATDDVMRAIELAREFPSTPFVALSAYRANDASIAARAAAYDFADFIVEGTDDHVAREIVTQRAFTTRFAAALADPPEALHLDTPLRRGSWRVVVGHAGRPIHTHAVAEALGVTREHLSRAFGAAGAPNLKRVIDLVRLAAAAELSKNPGHDVGDVARVLGFASSSHLSTTSQRILGIRPTSLARLRTVDLVEHFVHGRMRSRPVVPRPRRGNG